MYYIKTEHFYENILNHDETRFDILIMRIEEHQHNYLKQKKVTGLRTHELCGKIVTRTGIKQKTYGTI